VKRQNRGLWVSVVFVLVLVTASAVGLLTGRLSPTLGLDLRGGVAVILSAPEGTPADVMDQTLENIRNRVDAFGVGEPDIVLSSNTIEVQIPGLGNSTIEQRAADLYCLVGPDDVNHGCADAQATAIRALEGLEVTSAPSEVCLVAGDDAELECFNSRPEALAAQAGITIEGASDPSPSASPGTSPSASASPTVTASPTVGPGGAFDRYCLTNFAGDELTCYESQAEAKAALDGIELAVRARTYCVQPSLPEPTPSPSPTPSGSATPSMTPSPTPSPSPSGLDAFNELDLDGASDLPCGFDARADADEASAAIEVRHVTTRSCVVSSAGEELGCLLTVAQAEERRQRTGQERLLNVIGTTARLEERPTLEIIAPTDPRWQSLPITCFDQADQDAPECKPGSLDGETVVFIDPTDGSKVRLGPVIITGANIDSASAQLIGGTQTQIVAEWVVAFELDGEGSDRFSAATTQAVASTPPQDQIAIVVDRQVVSNPQVQQPITNGQGQISGGFTEQSAKDLATVLNAGALPVELTQEAIRTVSPTLGEESLRQGIVAGVAGLIFLFLYLLLYYRLLGVVAWFGMGIWALLALALVSLAGQQLGYALSLAGVAGLVISLGVTADSYIVFFERLKDEMRGGRSARAVVEPAFARSFKTIVAADIVTAIAAFVLYITAVSSVRGFALTLGVATALDLFVVWFFKRPTVILIARSPKLVRLRGLGLSAATAADHGAIETTGDLP